MTIASKHYKSQRNQAPATKYKNPLSQKDGGFFVSLQNRMSNRYHQERIEPAIWVRRRNCRKSQHCQNK
ncbi:SSH2 protein [Roseibium sp. TrichSKD4]|nr:SSH2 protein [Roseibium sp. TrichSKD4]